MFKRGIKNPGFFFTMQMSVMIAIRLLGGQIFDRFSKVVLVIIALLATGGGFGLLRLIHDTAWILPIAVVFGLGMGLCVPPLNSLMYLVTKPPYRGFNANMMMLSVHFGNFMGPFVGAWIIDAGGYDLFLTAGILITGGAAGFFFIAKPRERHRSNLRVGKKSPSRVPPGRSKRWTFSGRLKSFRKRAIATTVTRPLKECGPWPGS